MHTPHNMDQRSQQITASSSVFQQPQQRHATAFQNNLVPLADKCQFGGASGNEVQWTTPSRQDLSHQQQPQNLYHPGQPLSSHPSHSFQVDPVPQSHQYYPSQVPQMQQQQEQRQQYREGLPLEGLTLGSQACGDSTRNISSQEPTSKLQTFACQQKQEDPAADNQKILQVGLILQLITSQGDNASYSNTVLTPFHSHEVPNINILLYYIVISYNSGLFDAQAPCILVLLERLCQSAARKGHPIFINSFTVHRLILTAVLVTSKMYNDTYYTNTLIASVGGVTLSNINEMESYFVTMVDWKLHITPEEFDFYDKSCDRVTKQYQMPVPPPQAALSPMPSPSIQAQIGFPVQQSQQLQPQVPAQNSSSQSTLTFSHLKTLEQKIAMQQRQVQASLQDIQQMGQQILSQTAIVQEQQVPLQPVPIQQQTSQVDPTYQVLAFGRAQEAGFMPNKIQQSSLEAPHGLQPYQIRSMMQADDQMTGPGHLSATWNQTDQQQTTQLQQPYPSSNTYIPMSNPQMQQVGFPSVQQLQGSSNDQQCGVLGYGPQAGRQVQPRNNFL